MNKRKLLCLLLCVIMVASLAIPGTLAIGNATTGSIQVTQNGEKVTSVAIPQNGTATLTASGAGSYQWQILAGDTWVNIQGETGSEIRLSYAMVASLMPTSVRCTGDGAESKAVEVYLGDAPESQPVDAVSTYTVLKEATEIGNAQETVDIDALMEEISTAEAEVEEKEAALAKAREAETAAKSAYETAKANADALAPQTETQAEPAVTDGPSADDGATEASSEAPADNSDYEAAVAEADQAKTILDEATSAREEAESAYTAACNKRDAIETEALTAMNSGVSMLAAEDEELKQFTIEIHYYRSGTTTEMADTWMATLPKGASLTGYVIQNPDIQGYTAVDENGNALKELTLNVENIQENITYSVNYIPADVGYTVRYFEQNVNDDGYTQVSEERKAGYTEGRVESGLNQSKDGFVAQWYDDQATIAADGSTVVEIYYDRLYVLMSFDLDGGYGVEPIYARYGAPISVPAPTKAGYSFGGWTLNGASANIPSTMPSDARTYRASWQAGNAGYTIVFWYENADDDGYSYAGSTTARGEAGNSVSSVDHRYTSFTGRDANHFTYNASKAETKTIAGDGSTVLDVYFTRNKYTVYFCKTLNSQQTGEATYGSVTAKYQANIASIWPTKDSKLSNGQAVPSNLIEWVYKNNDTGGGLATKKYSMTDELCKPNGLYLKAYTGYAASKTINYYMEALPGQTGTTMSYNGKTYVKSDAFSQTLNNNADGWGYKEIDGFTAEKDGGNSTFKNGAVNLLYNRNRHTITFHNNYGEITATISNVMFEMPLNQVTHNGQNISDLEPAYPTGIEPNTIKFAGWYTTKDCLPGTEADFTRTMPNDNLAFYAKWVPITHDVTFYKQEGDTEPYIETFQVPHGSKIDGEITEPTNGDLTFVQWFYRDENGQEHAFAPDQMPVNQDLVLYAKWSATEPLDYTVKYQYEGTDIADPTTGKGLHGNTKTFEAKTGDQLNEGFQTGYYPATNSHSLILDANDPTSREFIFEYFKMPTVDYIVKYVDKATGAELATRKEASTSQAIITENYVYISGYVPTTTQERLVLSAEQKPNIVKNVITFYYEKDADNVSIDVIHRFEGMPDIDGTSRTRVPKGITFEEDLMNMAGYEYVSAEVISKDTNLPMTDVAVTVENGKASLTVPNESITLILKYEPKPYPYMFQFKDTEGNILAAPVIGQEKYKSEVTQQAKDIPGYNPIQTSWMLSIKIEDMTLAEVQSGSQIPEYNLYTFIYTQEKVNINYQVIGPEGSGTVKLNQTAAIAATSVSEEVLAATGTPNGAVATPTNSTYRFVCWYYDAECTKPVTGTPWISGENGVTILPQKTGDKDANGVAQTYEAATYYAKFEYNLTSMTIYKTGNAYESSDRFIFDILHDGTKVTTVTLGVGDHVTISGLTVGETYTVHERTTNTRYTAQADQTCTLKPAASDNTVTFNNSVKENKWLTSSKTVKNEFTKG